MYIQHEEKGKGKGKEQEKEKEKEKEKQKVHLSCIKITKFQRPNEVGLQK